MATRLKPCPFCGGKAVGSSGGGYWAYYRIECTRCYVMTGKWSSKTTAIKKWNARAPSPMKMGKANVRRNPGKH